ncbi:MAG: hypothetical protein IJ633_00355 [Prevotella sp.]|nr:hypothetical protein [Prevotella sp.]
MIKKAYMKPTMGMVKIQPTQLICASLTSVTTTGLGEEMELPDGDIGGSVWDDAW